MEIETEWEREEQKEGRNRANGPSPSSRNVAVHPVRQSIVRWKRERSKLSLTSQQ